MNVRVLFFAQVRERVGVADAELALAAGSRVRDALAALEREYPAIAPLRAHLAVAVNGQLVPADAPIPDGAELAVLPPVSGG